MFRKNDPVTEILDLKDIRPNLYHCRVRIGGQIIVNGVRIFKNPTNAFQIQWPVMESGAREQIVFAVSFSDPSFQNRVENEILGAIEEKQQEERRQAEEGILKNSIKRLKERLSTITEKIKIIDTQKIPEIKESISSQGSILDSARVEYAIKETTSNKDSFESAKEELKTIREALDDQIITQKALIREKANVGTELQEVKNELTVFLS